MGRVVLDSSCLIAIFKESDAHHKTIVNRLLQADNHVVLSTIALSESLVYAYRANEGEAAKKLILEWVAEVIDVDSNIAAKGAELRALHGIELGDALIGATAILQDCTLLTFDEKFAKVIPGAELLS